MSSSAEDPESSGSPGTSRRTPAVLVLLLPFRDRLGSTLLCWISWHHCNQPEWASSCACAVLSACGFLQPLGGCESFSRAKTLVPQEGKSGECAQRRRFERVGGPAGELSWVC
ncbi:hypothetical protein BDZ91DRAFT_737904 [Kalaharituber pfeilii]|nr:hypothetical protein BDZ91DRAFT_737904 [Kalaharituber pfeilii]